MFFTRKKAVLTQDELDVQQVLRMLSISEYRLFELAYSDWFGTAASEHQLEGYYKRYLFSGFMPCWLRQYIRNIQQCQKHTGNHDEYEHKQILRESKSTLIVINLDSIFLLMVLLSVVFALH